MSEPLELQVTCYPDPILRKVAQEVPFDAELKALVEEMFKCMYFNRGVGLAAPQVGLKKRVMILNPDGEPSENGIVLVNPTIVRLAGPKSSAEEGCLSFPDIYADVLRPERCTIKAFDVDGNETEKEYDGFRSRIIQHEFDHLEGVLLVDRMTAADRLRNKDELALMKDRYRAQKVP